MMSDKHDEEFSKLINKRKGILFLDFDGCLNSQDYYKRRMNNIQINYNGSFHLYREYIKRLIKRDFYEYCYPDSIIDSLVHLVHEIDVDALERLNNFCIKNELDVVISSTWRLGNSLDFLVEGLRFCLGLKKSNQLNYGEEYTDNNGDYIRKQIYRGENCIIPDNEFMRIIDVTPNSKDRIRGVEIHRWLTKNIHEKIDGHHYFDYKSYLIIDDDSDMLLGQRNNFFKCCSFVGITDNYLKNIQNFIDSNKFKNIKSFNKNRKNMITIIACVDENMGIGFNDNLLVKLKNDMKFFRETTTGHTVIMGRGTFRSIGNKPLPNRKNLVCTTSPDHGIQLTENLGVINDLLEYLYYAHDKNEDFYIIGGQEIYNQAILDYADRLLITHVKHKFEYANKFFPEIHTKEWEYKSTILNDIEEIQFTRMISKDSEEVIVEKINMEYSIKEYIRIKN